MIESFLKNTLKSLAQYKRHVIQAQFVHNLSFVYMYVVFPSPLQIKLDVKNRNFQRPKTLNFIKDCCYQGGCGMSVFLKGYNFEHTEMSIHFLSFNVECAIVKEANDANMLSQESKLTRINLQLNLCPLKSTTPVLKRILFFQYLLVYL